VLLPDEVNDMLNDKKSGETQAITPSKSRPLAAGGVSPNDRGDTGTKKRTREEFISSSLPVNLNNLHGLGTGNEASAIE